MLYIPKDAENELIRHARAESPNEACGILAGPPSPEKNFREAGLRRVNKVTKVYKMTNTEKSPTRFFMDPKEQLRIMKEMRNKNLEMVGIYHSHPETGAYPSAHDVELVFYPEASYVIVSLKDKNNPDIRSFKIVDGNITEEELKIK